MQKLLYFSITVYVLFYAFESPIRYALNLSHADELIFLRDLLLAAPIVMLLVRQVLEKTLHPAFIAFAFIIGLHGAVMVLNTHSWLAVAYGAKMWMGMLAGALAAPYFFAPSRHVVMFFLALWVITATGVALDKYYVDFPWTGMQTIIGDTQVDISRNWQVTGEDKRAGGFMRGSVNVAICLPLVAMLLFFHSGSKLLQSTVVLGTLVVLYWTTQKGALIAYSATLALMAIPPTWRFGLLRIGFFGFALLMIGLPLVLPGTHMPQYEWLASFNLRVGEMWPAGWNWIALHQLFPFGIGLGGLGGAQRTWAADNYTAGDNLFIFLYASFGLMTFVYLGWLAVTAVRLDTSAPAGKAQAMATLMFLMGYGCVLSLLEDQMALLFSGAAAAWLAGRGREMYHKYRDDQAESTWAT